MKNLAAAAVIVLCSAPSGVIAGERVGSAALGALAGAVVLGPIGAAAGAAIGYTAGPSIAESWGLRRSEPRRAERSAKAPRNTAAKRAPATQSSPTAVPDPKNASAQAVAVQAARKDVAVPAKPAAQTEAAAPLPH